MTARWRTTRRLAFGVLLGVLAGWGLGLLRAPRASITAPQGS